jgi:hypothetical protein
MKKLKYIMIGIILFGLFSFIGNSKKGSEIVKELDEAEYFKYTKSEKLEEIKNNLIESFDKYKILSTINDDDTYEPFDSRLHFCDGEALFEIGGIEEYLTMVKPAFEKRKLNLNWENEISEENGNNWKHLITVNGKEYVVFEGDMTSLFAWGIAQKKFYELLNDQLEIQNSGNRIYPISGGEQGEFVFLSDEQFKIIKEHFYKGKDFQDFDRIYNLKDWIKVNELEKY